MHFHCVVIDGVFDTTAAGGVVFHDKAGLDGQHVLRSFVQRGLLAGDDARAMGQWAHGGGFSMDGSVRIEAADRAGRERLLRYCARPPFTLDRYVNWGPERLLCEAPNPVRAATARCS